MFLIQGILDRSETFSPHPPINLSDPEAIEQYIKLIHDEETGLPSANPPSWEAYRDGKNTSITKGTYVYAHWREEYYDQWERPGHREKERKHEGIYEVASVKKDRTAVLVRWSRGKREGWEFPTGWGNGYGRWGEWEYKNKWKQHWVPMKDCFNVDAYVPGEYKTFLCDAYLKGAYLELGTPTSVSREALAGIRMRISSIIFVGQGPSENGDPYLPLEGRIGEKLGDLLEVTDFAQSFARINLNSEWIGKGSGGKGDVFDRSEGKTAAKVLLRGSWTKYVLLGKLVALCFDANGEPLDTVRHGVKSFFLLPHPSGINRWWNNPANESEAKKKLKAFIYD